MKESIWKISTRITKNKYPAAAQPAFCIHKKGPSSLEGPFFYIQACGGGGTGGDAKNFFEKVRLNMGLRVKREVRADKVTKELSDFECPRALSKNFEKGWV